MNFKSLNSAIRSVTNPQPKLVKEDIQTPQRKAEGEKEIKNLSRTRTRRLKSWTKHPNPGSSGYYDAEDRFDKANSAKAARQDQQSSERSSSDTYGKGGKIVKKGKVQKPIEKKGDYVYSHYRDATITKAQASKDSKSKIFNKMGTVKEEQEYIELLEFALEAIAEELECDVEDLLEDIQTRDRQVQMKRKLKRSDNLVGKANAEVNKRERAEDRAYSNLSADDDFLKVAKTSDRADTARDNRERTDKTHSSLVNLNSRERKSKKLFGKGGKVIKKATVKEEQEYIERLESALESIAEELECSVEDLLEDLQTRGRYLQVDRKATHSERLADIKGRKERKSKKVYGMHGKELAPSAAAYFKKHPTASRLLHNPSTAGD